ncbi:galactose-binding domain-containing protein [Aestuariimicrobium soli]|uniref:galactose-binding domain-containing protein n=1 Tax=Aestuariimicrobium soli TaxID=2035834 RepID=UPI003EBDA7A3
MHTPSRPSLPRRARLAIGTVVSALALSVAVTSASAPPTGGPGGYGNTVSDGADPNQPRLSLGAQWWPYSVGPGQLGAIPEAIGVDQIIDGRRTKKVFMAVTRNADSSGATLRNTMKVAEDNGLDFTDYTGLPTGFNWSSGGKRADGSLVLVKFTPTTAPAPNRHALTLAGSSDLGKTWKTWNAPIIENKWPMAWYRTTRSFVVLPDGTLLQGVYGASDAAGKQAAAMVLQSTDGGLTWSQRSRVNPTTDGDSGELAFSQTSDGRLIAITRSNEGSGNPTRPMKQAYSDDDGLTWHPQTTYVPPAGLPKEGILPDLTLQTNGALVLSYGRPDNNIAVSWDGTGETWDTGKVTFANYIRTTERGRTMGSSGNGSVISADSNYALQFGDICHNEWTCREHGQENGAWVRRVDVVTPGKGKLDLATGVRDGVMKLTGAVVPPDARFAEQRIEGAVDGSNQPRAAARLAEGGPKQITLQLDRTYTLNRIGLMLDRGVENGAKVQVSTDGITWSSPVVRQRNSTDFALRYHDITPVQARFVRVSNDGSAPFTALNELELYDAGLWTFENDAINTTPRGTVDTLHAFTADTLMKASHSQRRAILVDMDPDTRATMTFPSPDLAGMDLTFDYAAAAYGSGAIWDILGRNAAGEQVTAWKFWFHPGGGGFAVSAWDGSAWHELGVIPTFTPNTQWFDVAIHAKGGQASMTVHGVTLTTSVKADDAVALTGFRPSTGFNVADQNIEHSFDNLRMTELPDTVVGTMPASTFSYLDTPTTLSLQVHNFAGTATTSPVTVSAPAGYNVEGPSSVTVPANAVATVSVVVTRAQTSTTAAPVTVTIGDQSRTILLQPTDDWVRSASMTASSSSAQSSPENLNEGKTDTTVWGGGGGGAWNDNTGGAFPDWVQATWASAVTLAKVDLYTLDSSSYPASRYGVRDVDVQVRASDGSWTTVAQVRGNTQGTMVATFEPVTTTALRIVVIDSNDHTYSRLISVQAFGS